MSNWKIYCLSLLIVCLYYQTIMAADKIESLKIPLNQLMSIDEPLKLRNSVGIYDIFLPISARIEPKAIKLHLEFTNSISLLKERSSLSILINNKSIAQFILNPNNPETIADVIIPQNFLKPGYNRLTFRAQQHYTLKCEDPAAPELWTEIDTVNSYIVIETALKPLPPKLANIKDIFDPKFVRKKPIYIMLGGKDETYKQLSLLAAQGVGLRLGYSQPTFEVVMPSTMEEQNVKTQQFIFSNLQQKDLQGSDTIYIATRADLVNFVKKDVLDLITGPFIGLYPLDITKTDYILLISGTTLEEVKKAVTAFTFINFPFPDTQYMIVKEQELPKVELPLSKNIVMPNGRYRFADFNLKTKTIKGNAPEILHLELFIPPWIFALERDVVKLDLHLAYSAGMRKDSTLNVLLNGKFERSIWLNEEAGAIYQHYVVTIPLNSFRPGPNRLSFAANMIPMITGECQIINSDGLILTLFDDSVVSMPNVPTFIELPNLSLLATTGFPYNFKGDGSELAIFIPPNDNKALASACSVLSKLAQLNGYPMYLFSTISTLDKTLDKEILIFSTLNDSISQITKNAPIVLNSKELAKMPYPVGKNIDLKEESYQNLFKIAYNAIRDVFIPQEIVHSDMITFITQNSGLGDTLIIMQFESPFISKRSVTLFIAANSDNLLNGVTKLMEPSIWHRLDKAACVLNMYSIDENDKLACQDTNKRFSIGQKTYSFSFYFSRYPWIWLGIALFLIFVISFLLYHIIRIYKHKKHANLQEHED